MVRCKCCGEMVNESDICQGYCVDCFDYEKIEKEKSEEKEDQEEKPLSFINAWQLEEAKRRSSKIQ